MKNARLKKLQDIGLSVAEPRTNGRLCGERALQLAVFEDGIRAYLSEERLIQREADVWIHYSGMPYAFGFSTLCEQFGLDPQAVRKALRNTRTNGIPKRIRPRGRLVNVVRCAH